MSSESGTLTIRLNGQDRPVDSGQTIVSLLRQLGEDSSREDLAVALNGEIVPRREWTATTVEQGDSIEIVRAFQGG